ncbi:thermonuclease family protein [Halalkalibacter wakoensis]|nr:thermonuclease family protein [Halalkalibacter wakoensis]
MRLSRIVVGLFVVFLCACAPVEQEVTEGILASDALFWDGQFIVADVERVVDGDTIRITNLNVDYVSDAQLVEELLQIRTPLRVRFLAIDTPEWTNEKQWYGKESTELVQQLLSEENVVIEIDENADFDRFDRLLGHVFTTQGVNVQEELLRNGLARVAYLYDDYQYVDMYIEAEAAAKDEELHIHSIPDYVTERGFDMSVVE